MKVEVGAARLKSIISSEYSVALDGVRATAALTVVIGHAGQIGLYAGTWPLPDLVQHVAVIIFFVLSGLVISSSTKSRRLSLRDFAVARISRILPVALMGIALGNAAFFVARAYHLNFDQPHGYDRPDLLSVVMPLTFMSMSTVGTGPVANPPFWSLCYEVWYYALFAAAVFLRGRTRIGALCGATIAAGPRIIILMPVWLTGVILCSRLRTIRVSALGGLLFVVAGSVSLVSTALHAFALKAWSENATGMGYDLLNFSQFWLADWLMAPAVAAILVGLIPLSEAAEPWLRNLSKPIRLMAGSSFTLYLLHWPVISLIVAFGFCTDRMSIFFVVVAAVVALAAAVSRLTEGVATAALKTAMKKEPERPLLSNAVA